MPSHCRGVARGVLRVVWRAMWPWNGHTRAKPEPARGSGGMLPRKNLKFSAPNNAFCSLFSLKLCRQSPADTFLYSSVSNWKGEFPPATFSSTSVFHHRRRLLQCQSRSTSPMHQPKLVGCLWLRRWLALCQTRVTAIWSSIFIRVHARASTWATP